MGFLFYFFIFLFGLCVGSFLNVVICRLETSEGIVKKRSHCPKCGRVLRWYDLVPVLSFVFLRGRCRYCSQKISWQYPLVEIATGLLFLFVFWNFGFGNWDLFRNSDLEIRNFIAIGYWLFVISCLIVIFVYDLRHYIIPDKIIFPAIIVSLVFRFFEVFEFRIWDLFGIWKLEIRNWQTFLFYALAGLAASAFFLTIVLITKGKGMGVGDIKLAFLMGLILGWPQILVALLLAFSAGALVGLGLIAAKQKTLKSQIPFGPFLTAATIFVMFWGEKIISWYFDLFVNF